VNWSDEEGVTALQIAAANGRDDIVEYLLCHDAIIDKPNNLGWTSLMHAARNGHASTVDTLINYGANVQLKNGMGNFSLC
jgi:ankyrin repeat protein